MKGIFHLKIGGVCVGVISNLHLDWPHWLGDFQPTPEFHSVEGLFSKMSELNDEKRYDERNEQRMLLYQMGVAIVAANGSVLVERTGEINYAGEIGLIFVSKSGISFRVCGPGFPKRGAS